MNTQTWARPTSSDRQGRRFVRFVPVIAIGASLIAAAPASATTVSADYGKGVLSIQASPGSSDHTSITTATGGFLRITTDESSSSFSLSSF